jgi:hypothetical protein
MWMVLYIISVDIHVRKNWVAITLIAILHPQINRRIELAAGNN